MNLTESLNLLLNTARVVMKHDSSNTSPPTEPKVVNTCISTSPSGSTPPQRCLHRVHQQLLMPVSPDGRRYHIPRQLAAPCSANTCHYQIRTTFHAINKLADVPGLSYTLSTRSWCYDSVRNHLGQVHKGSHSSSFHDPLMCSRIILKLSHSRQKTGRIMKQCRTSFQTTI
jgi:hypothetical protein